MWVMMTQLRGLLLGTLAGALGGALLGIAESALVSATSARANEYWLFLFGVIAYGAIGAGLAFGIVLLWQLVRRGAASDRQLAHVGIVAAVALPMMAVARYHVAQRIFEEKLPVLSASGLLVHAALVVAALVAVGLAVVLVRGCYRLGGTLGVPAALVVAVAAAALIGVVTDASEPPAPASRAQPRPAEKPNIVLIVVDTLRADAAEWVRRQSGAAAGFARLADDGVVFTRAYAQSSWTRPSIATILSAQYPSVHGTVHKMDFLSNDVLTIAEALKGHGYSTAAFTTNINVAPIFNFQQGFDEFHYLAPSFYFGATDSATKLAVYKGLRVAREKLSSKMWAHNYYQDAAVVDRHVAAWLARPPAQPFFLFIHYMDPHDPYFEIPYNGEGIARVSSPSPDPSRAEELHALYREDVRYFDGYLATLLTRLDDAGLYDRSLVAITADHGEEFYEHQGWWHGTSLYDEQVHVPLIVKRPDEPEGGRVRTDVARTLDIAPTLLAAADLPIPSAFQGIDLFTGIVADPLLAEEDLEGNRLSFIRMGDWKLITANRDNPRGLPPLELFNLADDPREQANLAAREGARVTDMLAQLEQFRSRVAARRGSPERATHHAADPRS